MRKSASEAIQLAVEIGETLWLTGPWAAKSALAALRGEQAVASDFAARAEQTALPVRASESLALTQYARGLLTLGQGRHGDAFAELRRVYEPGDPAHNQRLMLAFIGDLAEAASHSILRGHSREPGSNSPTASGCAASDG